ncbi:MAG: hypothetical protein ACJAT2_000834 [Bacteriovoracaceae bacterium]|jgi:hypothetical protein
MASTWLTPCNYSVISVSKLLVSAKYTILRRNYNKFSLCSVIATGVPDYCHQSQKSCYGVLEGGKGAHP